MAAWGLRLGTVAAILLLWHMLSLVLPPWLLPPLSEVAGVIGSGRFLWHVQVTLSAALPAFFLAACIGIVAGVFCAKVALLRISFYPYLVALGSLPASCFAPIINLWLGIGLASKVFSGAIMSFLVIAAATITGISRVERSVKEAAQIDGAGFFRSLVVMEFPLALPSVLAGLRVGWTMALIGAVVSELYGAHGGVGHFIMVQNKMFRPEGIFAGAIALAILSYSGFLFFDRLEKRVVLW